MNTCWVVTEGKAGMELQGIAMAELLKIPNVSIKKVTLRFPWKYISPTFRLFKEFSISSKGDQINAPYPDLVITVGRRSVIAGLLIKSKSPKTKLICINNPRISSKYFDVVIPSKHDGLKESENIVPVFGSVHRINTEKLNLAAEEFKEIFSKYTNPCLGIILGGNNKYYSMTLKTAEKLIDDLKKLENNFSFLITASRRTPQNILNLFANCDLKNKFYWDYRNKEIPNPYIGILASSNALIVTCESSNMISEACSTNLPVYLLPLPGFNKRFDNLHKDLIKIKRIEWFNGEICLEKKEPLNSMQELVTKVRKKIFNI